MTCDAQPYRGLLALQEGLFGGKPDEPIIIQYDMETRTYKNKPAGLEL
jgi:hypothetical protein